MTTINVAADDGVGAEQLADRIEAAVPARLQVRTGDAAADENAAEINDQIGGFLTPALLTFAGAALLVGAFIIFNTFTITVAERTREFALLRTLGATRASGARRRRARGARHRPGRLARSASVSDCCSPRARVAVRGGRARDPDRRARARPADDRRRAAGRRRGHAARGARPGSPRHPRRPDAALQGAAQSAGSRRHWAPWSRSSSRLAGVGTLVAGLFASGPAASRLSVMAVGVVLLFIGVALSARWFVRPLAGAIGWPLERLFAEPGLLARENAMRNPGRTATTAAALMVGLGLVVFVAVFANGIKASFDDTVNRVVSADLVVRSETMRPIPAGAGRAVAASGDVATEASVLIDQVKVDGKDSSVLTDIINGVEPAALRAPLQRRLGTRRRHGARAPARRQRARRGAVRQGPPRRRRRLLPDRDTLAEARPGCASSASIAIPSCSRARSSRRTLFARISAARDPWIIFADLREGVPTADGQAPRRSGARGLPDRGGRVAGRTTATRSAPSSTSSSTSSTRCSP